MNGRCIEDVGNVLQFVVREVQCLHVVGESAELFRYLLYFVVGEGERSELHVFAKGSQFLNLVVITVEHSHFLHVAKRIVCGK